MKRTNIPGYLKEFQTVTIHDYEIMLDQLCKMYFGSFI